jgi:hypothetical protein
MLKAPRPGTVKTRLAAEVGADSATRIYRQLAERQLAAVPAEWALEVHFSPAEAEAEMRAWLGPRPKLTPQTGADLGARMANALTSAWAAGRAEVLVVGGDCPELDEALLREAARQLETHDVVLGPANDGGYYLIGLKAPCPALFAGMAWSTDTVYAETLRRAADAGLRVGRLPLHDDVDTLADWRRCLATVLGLRERAAGGEPA